MPLKSETTVEYYFNNPYIYYCKEHNCLRISEHHEDSVICNGIDRKTIEYFISNYIDFVLNNDELKEAFKEALEDETEEELTDCEGRPI